nr:invertase [Gongronella sp. w5]
MVLADPFTNMQDSFGKIETGYGANDADFVKYRPKFHVIGPVNWMNDPSAPYFDGTHYHIYYQHNPYAQIWGNMTWGHATSTDLLHWQDQPFALYPNSTWDMEGAFDGTCMAEKGYQGKTTLIYTAVSYSGPTYVNGQEKQVLAVTDDNGNSWTRIKPVINGPPDNFVVNGFRDPYLFRSASFDAFLNMPTAPDSIYMTVSSGIPDKGGRLWLYHSSDWENWDFHGPFLFHPPNHVASPNPAFYGNDGVNWEVASYFELPDPSGGDSWHIATWGSQGGRNGEDFDHWALWTAGQQLDMSMPDTNEVAKPTPRIHETMSGVYDWGISYAQMAFKDAKDPNGRYLAVGWVQDDVIAPATSANRWNGVLGLYRELFIQEINGIDASDPLLQEGYASWVYDASTNKVKTLGMRPLPEYASMRGTGVWSLPKNTKKTDLSNLAIPIDSTHVEIDAVIALDTNSDPISFVVRQSAKEETVITYIPSQGNIFVNRTASTSRSDLWRTSDETHALPLFRVNNGGLNGTGGLEPLHLRVFVDNSLIEVFANDRYAVSTRIYPDDADATRMALRAPANVKITSLNVYPITDSAFNRP